MARRTALFLLPLALAACAPQPRTGAETVLLVPGGRIVGAWAELPEGAFPLPGPPLFADRAGGRLYLAYPYGLEVYQDGTLAASYPLPGVPTFLHARPGVVVGTTEGVFVPDRNLPPYPARDARWREALWWTDGPAHRDDQTLDPGPFRRVVADRKRVAFLGREAYFPGGARFPLPPFRDAELWGSLYLLTDEEVVRYAVSGAVLDRRRGRYLDLAVDATGVWLLDPQGRPVHLDPDLREAP